MTPLPRSEYIRIPLKFLSAPSTVFIPSFSTIQFYLKLPKACTVYHTREKSHKTTLSRVCPPMVTCRPAPPASSVTSPTVWPSLSLSTTSASSSRTLPVPMISSTASSYTTHSRSRKMQPSTSALPSLSTRSLAPVCTGCHCQGPATLRPSFYLSGSISCHLPTASFRCRRAHSR
jgi:hypothetical protein